jgi:hypothetical protein
MFATNLGKNKIVAIRESDEIHAPNDLVSQGKEDINTGEFSCDRLVASCPKIRTEKTE